MKWAGYLKHTIQKSNTWVWFDNINKQGPATGTLAQTEGYYYNGAMTTRWGWTKIIHLFHCMDQWQALINTALNLWILQNLELLY
jgi:hypothetical protein